MLNGQTYVKFDPGGSNSMYLGFAIAWDSRQSRASAAQAASAQQGILIEEPHNRFQRPTLQNEQYPKLHEQSFEKGPRD